VDGVDLKKRERGEGKKLRREEVKKSKREEVKKLRGGVETMKKIPYGIADFKVIQDEGYYYVDKTMFIPMLEAAGKFLFFIRPRRFGKTLFLNVLESYYDLAWKDEFDNLFRDTSIKTHPTPEKHSYLILKFNFSQVNPDPEKVEASFNGHVENRLFFFGKKYRELLGDDYFNMMARKKDVYEKLEFLLQYVGAMNLKVYILIDEYDNFANTILSTSGQAAYHDLTHGTGFFRFFFNILKGGTSDTSAGIGRLFITGVSPVTMDDVTSGFNIGRNMSLDAKFNQVLGFTEHDVFQMVGYYREHGLSGSPPDEMLAIMREWYDHYCFSKDASNHLFNTDMVLYFVQRVLEQGTYPDDLVDENVKIDYGKLRHLIVLDRQFNGNFQQLAKLLETEGVQSHVVKSFPVEKLIELGNFISLLFYLGLLSYAEPQEGESYLRIPNRTVKTLMYSYLRDGYEDVDVFRLDLGHFAHLVHEMAYRGEWEPVFRLLADEVAKQTSIRDYLSGEKVIQTFLLAYLNVADYYITRSEEEMGKGYADLYLEPFFPKYPDIKSAYLIEIKYLNRKEWTEELQKAHLEEARKQLQHYAGDERVIRKTQKATLTCLVLIFCGWELKLVEEVVVERSGREEVKKIRRAEENFGFGIADCGKVEEQKIRS
jgi:hypothetical protein